jgi:hypothetical protein
MVAHLRFTEAWVNKIMKYDKTVFSVSVNDRIKLSYWRMTVHTWLDKLEHVERIESRQKPYIPLIFIKYNYA